MQGARGQASHPDAHGTAVVADVDVDLVRAWPAGRLALLAAGRRGALGSGSQPGPDSVAAGAQHLDGVQRERQVGQAIRGLMRRRPAQADGRLEDGIQQARMHREAAGRCLLGHRQTHPGEHAGLVDPARGKTSVAGAIHDAHAFEGGIPERRIHHLGLREGGLQGGQVQAGALLRPGGTHDPFAAREVLAPGGFDLDAEAARPCPRGGRLDEQGHGAVDPHRANPGHIRQADRGRPRPRGPGETDRLMHELQLRHAGQHGIALHLMVAQAVLLPAQGEAGTPRRGLDSRRRQQRMGGPTRIHAGGLGFRARCGHGRRLRNPVAFPRKRVARQVHAAHTERPADFMEAGPGDRRALDPGVQQGLELAAVDPDVQQAVQAGHAGGLFGSRMLRDLHAAPCHAGHPLLARDEGRQPGLQLSPRRHDKAHALRHGLAPDLQRVGQVCQARRRLRSWDARGGLRGDVLDVLAQCTRCVDKAIRGLGRQQHHRRSCVHRGRAGRGRPVVHRLFQDHVRVHPSDAEGADARPTWQWLPVGIRDPRPVQGVARDEEGTVGQVDVGVQCLAVQAAHALAVLHLQQHLDHARHTGSELQVTHIGLEGPQRAAAVPAPLRALRLGGQAFRKGLLERIDLDGIAELRARAMRFEVADGPGVHGGAGMRLDDDLPLCRRIGRREGVGVTAMVDGTAPDDAVDGIAVPPRRTQALQEQHADTFAADKAVRLRREGLAAAVRGQHAGLAKADVGMRRQDGLHAADQRELGIPAGEAHDRPVEGHQGRRTGRLHRLAGAVQVQEVADPVDGDGGHDAQEGVAFDALAGRLAQVAVAALGHADEQGRLAARQVPGVVAGVLDGPPGMHQQLAVRGVHLVGLPRGDVEEQRIEFRQAVDEAAPSAAGQRGILCGLRRAGAPVPTVGRNLGDAVPALEQVSGKRRHVTGAREPAAHADDRDVVAPILDRRGPRRGLRRRLGPDGRRHRCGLLDGWHCGHCGRSCRLRPLIQGRVGLQHELGNLQQGGTLEEGRRVHETRSLRAQRQALVEAVAQSGQGQRVQAVVAEVLVLVDVLLCRLDDLGHLGLQAQDERRQALGAGGGCGAAVRLHGRSGRSRHGQGACLVRALAGAAGLPADDHR